MKTTNPNNERMKKSPHIWESGNENRKGDICVKCCEPRSKNEFTNCRIETEITRVAKLEAIARIIIDDYDKLCVSDLSRKILEAVCGNSIQ